MKESEELSKDCFERLKLIPIFKGKVITGSMHPVIKVGEPIVVDVGNLDIKRFDIVVFFFQGKLVCHYLWTMNKVFTPVLYQTRNLFGNKDFPIDESAYLGKVISHRLNWWRKVRILMKSF